MTEPWLSGPLPDVDALLAPVFYTFEQTRNELRMHTEGLGTEQLWRKPHGMTAAGFHIRHIGGAVDRLGTYLRGEQLKDEQLAAMKRESDPGEDRQGLLSSLEASLAACESMVRGLDLSKLREPRYVGRKRLPTTVIGLVVHMAEHTQRHLGQAITTLKLVRAMDAGSQTTGVGK